MKKLVSAALVSAMAIGMIGSTCMVNAEEAGTTYKVGICNYVDDASLNQIVANIESQLESIGTDKGVTFEVQYDNCNADANVLSQIVANFIADEVDLMVGVATPVAMVMQSDTEDNQIPVVYSAVSDPVSVGLAEAMDKGSGTNITGTSDYLNTNAIMDLMFAANPDLSKVALLYDAGQDSSTSAIADAKAYLDEKGVEYKEYNGTNNTEVQMAAESIVADACDAVFTPTDNTIMAAELSIYETLAEAGIPQYCGADSFALNGSFVGYGVDYANLGKETANIVADILVNGTDPGTLAPTTFDNGIATVNTETCDACGFDLATIKEAFAPYCTDVLEIQTGEEFAE